MNWKRMVWKMRAALAVPLLLTACLQQPLPQGEVEVGDENGNTVTAQAVPTNGLRGDYYDNMDFTGMLKTRYDATVNRTFGTAVPITGIQPTTYSVRWTGQVMPAFSQTYTFYVTSSDGARLIVNGQVLVNDWVDGASRVRSGTVALQANVKYDIRLEYYRNATNPGSVKLEWQSPSRTRQVVPQASLFTTGSNIQNAVQQLQPQLTPMGITLETQHSYGVLSTDGIGFVSKEANSPNFVIAIVRNGTAKMLMRQTLAGRDLTITDLLTGKSVAMGDFLQYWAVDGSQTNAQKVEFLRKVAPALTLEGLQLSASFTLNSGRVTTQALTDCFVPPPTCLDCDDTAKAYRNSECSLFSGIGQVIGGGIAIVGGLGSIAASPLTGPAAPAAFWAGVGLVGGGVALGAQGVGLIPAQDQRDDAHRNWLECLRTKFCAPRLTGPTPAQLELTAPVNENATREIIFGNDPQTLSGTPLSDLSGIVSNTVLGSETFQLAPGNNKTVTYTKRCPSSPTTLNDQVTITSNDRDRKSVTIPVTIECIATNITVTAYVGGTVGNSVLPSGYALPATAIVSNDPSNAGVSWSVPSGVGSIVTIDGQPHYKAPLINPENRTVEVVATSNTDTTKKGIAYANIYAIQIQAYVNSSVSDSVMASISTLPLTASINNDALHAGATWSIPSGVGSIVTINGQPHYQSRPDTPQDEFITLKATSVSDPTKWSLATVRVLAIRVNATIDGSVNGAIVSSGGSLPIQGGVINDGSHKGVNWRIVSGGGSISGQTFQAPTLDCFPSGGTPTSVTSVVRATSNTDSSKYADASVRVLSVQCP
jgi:hypothetical protein